MWSPCMKLQFHRMNAHVKTAQRFTGPFNVKFRVQSRMARLHHLNAQYVAAQYQYLKQLVVLNQNEAITVCMDEKAVVSVGDPGMPLSTGVRPHNRVYSLQRKALNLWQWAMTFASMVLSHILKSRPFPYSHNNIMKKVPTRPILQNQKSKGYIFLY